MGGIQAKFPFCINMTITIVICVCVCVCMFAQTTIIKEKEDIQLILKNRWHGKN